MVLDILFTILGVFALVYFESLFLALFGFRLFIIIFFFLFRKVDWKPFFPVAAVSLLIFDVVYKLPLGSNMLMVAIPFGLYLLLSLFISLEIGFVSFFIQIAIFWFYYVLLAVLPNLFVTGQFGFLTTNNLLISLLRAVISVLVLFLLERLYASFRKRGNTSQIRLK